MTTKPLWIVSNPNGEPFYPSARATRDEALQACFGERWAGKDHRRDHWQQSLDEGWTCRQVDLTTEADRPLETSVGNLFLAETKDGRPVLRWKGHGCLVMPHGMAGQPLEMLVRFVNGVVTFHRDHPTEPNHVAR